MKKKSLYEIRVICSRCYCFAPPIEGLFGESSFEKPITAHIPPEQGFHNPSYNYKETPFETQQPFIPVGKLLS